MQRQRWHHSIRHYRPLDMTSSSLVCRMTGECLFTICHSVNNFDIFWGEILMTLRCHKVVFNNIYALLCQEFTLFIKTSWQATFLRGKVCNTSSMLPRFRYSNFTLWNSQQRKNDLKVESPPLESNWKFLTGISRLFFQIWRFWVSTETSSEQGPTLKGYPLYWTNPWW